MRKKKINGNLVKAIESESVEDCKRLIEAKAGVNYRIDDLQTIFQFACQQSSVAIIRLMIASKAEINPMGSVQNPLIIALEFKNVRIVPDLIRAKADLNIKYQQMTPLYLACKNQLTAAVYYLLAAKPKPDVNAIIPNRMPVLHFACLGGVLSIVKALVEAKADVYHETNQGNAPLFAALYGKQVEVVEYLLNGIVDVNHYYKSGQTVLHFAAKNFDASRVQLLIKWKADIYAKSKKPGRNEFIPLEFALVSKNKSVLELLKATDDFSYFFNEELLSIQEKKIFAENSEILGRCRDVLKNDRSLSDEICKKVQDIDLKAMQKMKELNLNLKKSMISKAIKLPEHKLVPEISPDLIASEQEDILLELKKCKTALDDILTESFAQSTQENKRIEEKELSSYRFKKQVESLLENYRLVNKDFFSLQDQYRSLMETLSITVQCQQIKSQEMAIKDAYSGLLDSIDHSNSELDNFQRQIQNYKIEISSLEQDLLRLTKTIERNKPILKPTKRVKKIKLPKKLKIKSSTIKAKKIIEIKPVKPLVSQPITVRAMPSLYYKNLTKNIQENICAGKFLLNQLEIHGLNTLDFQNLTKVKYALIRLLLNLAINQSQITRRAPLRNMRNTLHHLSKTHADMNPYLISIEMLKEQTQQLAEALQEFIELYKKNEFTDEFYLSPNIHLNFKSTLLAKMTETHFDTRAIADEKVHELLRQSSSQAKQNWIQLISVLMQPAMTAPTTWIVPAQENRLTTAFAILCQIASAIEAKQNTIGISADRNLYLGPALRAIAVEWRHRGLSLEQAAERLEGVLYSRSH